MQGADVCGIRKVFSAGGENRNMYVIRQHPHSHIINWRTDEDIVCAPRERGSKHDERTEVNGPLVYLLYRQVERRVAMSGLDNR